MKKIIGIVILVLIVLTGVYRMLHKPILTEEYIYVIGARPAVGAHPISSTQKDVINRVKRKINSAFKIAGKDDEWQPVCKTPDISIAFVNEDEDIIEIDIQGDYLNYYHDSIQYSKQYRINHKIVKDILRLYEKIENDPNYYEEHGVYEKYHALDENIGD